MSDDPLFTRRNADFAARVGEHADGWVGPLVRLRAALEAAGVAAGRPAGSETRATLADLGEAVRAAGLAEPPVLIPPVPDDHPRRERAGRRAAAGLFAAAAAGDAARIDAALAALAAHPALLSECVTEWNQAVRTHVPGEWCRRNDPAYQAGVSSILADLGLPEAEVSDEHRHLLRPPRGMSAGPGPEGQVAPAVPPMAAEFGPPTSHVLPHWDGATLRWKERSKEFNRRAKRVIAFLSAMQRLGWPPHVRDDDIPATRARNRRKMITDLVKDLGTSIPFLSLDTAPDGVRWNDHPDAIRG